MKAKYYQINIKDRKGIIRLTKQTEKLSQLIEWFLALDAKSTSITGMKAELVFCYVSGGQHVMDTIKCVSLEKATIILSD